MSLSPTIEQVREERKKAEAAINEALMAFWRATGIAPGTVEVTVARYKDPLVRGALVATSREDDDVAHFAVRLPLSI